MSAAAIERAEPENAEAQVKAHAPVSLNAVAISAAHLEAAMKVLAATPASRRDPPIQTRAVRQFARDAGFAEEKGAGAALHARITALSNWIEAHDPHGQSDTQAVLEAAARFPLSELPGGFGFDPAGFQEMVLFIEELPW
jgi:hypothetical protein